MISKTTVNIKRVAFFGDAMASENSRHFRDAKKVAKLLAESGYIIVNGGGPGIMVASTLGAKEGKGKVELVILDPKREPGNYEGTDKTNIKLADKVIKTANYDHRLNKLINVADAFVIFKGGTGTLSEVGLTWELAKFDYGHHEPLVFYGSVWTKVMRIMEKVFGYDKYEKRVAFTATKPEEVLKILKKVGRDS